MLRRATTIYRRLRTLSVLGRCPRRHQSISAPERALQYAVGQRIHGFTITEVTAVPDLFLTAVKLTHDSTGAQYLHAARDDKNNLFRVLSSSGRRPMDSTGVPHILEHTVLCGSERFPCRDPFFKMLNRSLSTFMNAFTASDYTMYPFSTQNAKDFQNLLSVYLDAVFFPCLRELDFWQEGWRLENEDPQDPSSPLVFKGVVFNEMKGAFSDNERLYAQHLQNKLLPDHTYAVVSGGEPLAIPDLTWTQLREFHRTHYHPSNARFFTYGDLPLEQHLKQIHQEALVRFQRTQPDTAVPTQQLWTSPREDHVTCKPDAMAPDPTKQNTLCVSYLLGDITEVFEGFVLSLLSSLMISGPNSPFYRALIEPKIGSDFSSVVGYDGSTRQASFSIGLQGMSEADNERVKRIINDTIDDIIVKGFEEERIEALLHKIEIQMKHQSSSFSLASLITPTHTQQVQQEEAKLQAKIQQLSQSDRQHIYQKGLELLSAQNADQDASCLPALKVSDIEPTIPHTPVQMGSAGGVPVQYCEQPTNGMVYFRALSNINTLPEALKPYVPLFCSVVTRMGCGQLDYRQQSQQMELRTGGMSVTPQILPDSTDLDMYEQGVLLSSSCLERNLPEMFHLWSEIFNSPHFDDEERLRVLVMMSAQELANGISLYGSHVIHDKSRLVRTLQPPPGDFQETLSGMDQVKFMKRVAESSDLTSVLRKLPRIKRHLLNPENMRCAVNATPQKLSAAAAETERFMGNIASTRKERSCAPSCRPETTGCFRVFSDSQTHLRAQLPAVPDEDLLSAPISSELCERVCAHHPPHTPRLCQSVHLGTSDDSEVSSR
ncbi:hypothetical protein AALO_G00240460 [Alosa alosa]|uniref:Presequence protease, mitochondrial n=1 Tax=Alosa alosa TaxID=278164 RepID=A0AAV6FU49_9TELE|nr:hypothetical protein AALO_G00240460 [Alosa alosa]